MKKGYDQQNRENDKIYEYLNWVDENRKVILNARIRKDLAVFPRLEFANPPNRKPLQNENSVKKQKKPEKERRYDPTEGFVIYWDYELGLPKGEGSKMFFDFQIVNHGQILYDTEEMQESRTLEESVKTLQSIIGQKSIIKGIPIDPETLLIWKVKMVDDNDPDSFTEIG